MIKNVTVFVLSITFGSVLQATVINTNNAGVVAAFQSGATVVNFESISGRTAQTITSYTSGTAVSASAFIFNQISGVQFSVGGMVGTNEPALYSLSGAIAGDAHSASTVLGPVDFDFNTKFDAGSMIEIFFPTKVSKVGFWLNPALSNVELIAADTNFGFSGLPETNLEGARALADGLRDKVETSRFVFQNEMIKVTVSVGVSMLVDTDRTSQDLIKRADERLYEAKRGGRNRVVA